MNTVESRLADLEERLQVLEDEREIHRLIISYGFAADTGDAERVAQRFAEEGVYDVGTQAVMNGRQGLRDMIVGEGHQSLLPNSAHTFGPSVIKVDGKDAVVTGYTLTYHRREEDFKLWRLSYTRVELEKRDGRWQILKRLNRLVGTDEAWPLFQQGLAELEG